MKSNLDSSRLDETASIAKDIRIWSGHKSHPEIYVKVKNLDLTRDFVHTLDLLETVLVRFEISAHLARLALEQLEIPERVDSLGWEFWQIDVEEFFAANLLDLCYQVSNAWQKIQVFAEKDKTFSIFRGKYHKPSATIIARHKATHFEPGDFERHPIAQQYSILRRPYQIRDGKLKKEQARYTLPRVANLIKAATEEGLEYLSMFRNAMVD